jgi:abortive infection bacteriophage resistance protein
MRIKVGFFMSKIKYTKQSLPITQQIQFLNDQGLIIQDQKIAHHVLSAVGYYRLSGYLLPFKQPHNNNQTPRKFKSGTTFDQIWQLYQFDRELRLLVIDAIEKIEVAFRAAITDITSVNLGPFWYTEKTHYKNERPYLSLMQHINRVVTDKPEVFIKHYFNKYNEPFFPPIWMIIETLSFGTCSKLFANIKHVEHKKSISKPFGYPPVILDSWIRTATYVRNICAHHARLWNRWLVNAPLIPKNDKYRKHMHANNRKFIVIAYLIFNILRNIAPKSPWRDKLYNLFEKYERFPGPTMGFTNNWRDDPFWEL